MKRMRPRVNYEVGDVIRVRSIDGGIRRVIVSSKEIFEGWHGFNGVYEDTRELVWGFDLQIESVVQGWRKEVSPIE